MSQVVGYCRVSSSDQDLAIQEARLTAAGATKLFREKVSGTTTQGREELARLLEFVRDGDEVLVTRIDRLARSMPDFVKIMQDWRERGIRFRAVDQPGVMLSGDATGDLFLNIMAAVAEFETRIRRDRQLEGIAKAKKEGVYKGRPKTVDVARIRAMRAAGEGATAIARELGIHRATVHKALGTAKLSD